VLGALVGAIVHFEGRRRGIDFPPIVGLFAGLAAALASRHESGLRGVLVASLAVWAAALADVAAFPSRGVISDLVAFHERLGFVRGASYVGCAVVAGLLASRARRGGDRLPEGPRSSA
jgi:hypothetical protein